MDIIITNKPDNQDIRQVIFKDINDRFSWGLYGYFKVIIDKTNGYINATRLCDEYGNGKQFKHWKENKRSKDLISEVKKELKSSSVENPSVEIKAIFEVLGGNTHLTIIRGSYVHKLLILDIASWCNSKFYILASKIVNEYAVCSYKILIKQLEQKTQLLSEDVDKLSTDNKVLSLNNNKLSSNIIKLTEDISNKDSLLYECAVVIEQLQEDLKNKVTTNNPPTEYKNKYEKAVKYLNEEELDEINYEVPKLKPYKENTFIIVSVDCIPYYPSNYDKSFIGLCFECFYILKNKNLSWLMDYLEEDHNKRILIEVPNPKNSDYIKLLREQLKDWFGQIKEEDKTSYAYEHSINNFLLFDSNKIPDDEELKNKIIEILTLMG